MLKRKREPKEDIASPSESGSDSNVSDRAKGGSKKARAGTGGSKAAMYSRSKQESFRKGTLIIDKKALENWKKQIFTNDQHAEFDPSNITRVRHSGCGRYFQVNFQGTTRSHTLANSHERVQAKQEEVVLDRGLLLAAIWAVARWISAVNAFSTSTVRRSLQDRR